MGIIINGYRTKENVAVSGFETIIKKVKGAIEQKQRALYVDLLSEEVNTIADYYILNYITINNGNSILDVAQERIAQRIDEANRTNAETRYNFKVGLEIMPFRKRWYFLVVSGNEQLYTGILDSVTELEKYITADDETSFTEEHEKVWEEIRQKYTSSAQPMRQTFFIQLPMPINAADIKLQAVQDRAFYQAESKEYGLIFQALTNGRKITPMEIMRYVDEVTIERGNPAHAANVQKNIQQLLTMLPNLTHEMISKPVGNIFNTNESIENAIEPIEESDEPADKEKAQNVPEETK